MDKNNCERPALKDFLEIPYRELEEMNLKAQEKAKNTPARTLQKEYTDYLKKEKKLKAVTICFTDIEGRFHMLDYDKKYFLDSLDNLTFDGSSIRGFTEQRESDLRLEVDWSSIRHFPSDVFGPGKVILFAFVLDKDRKPYASDFRSMLKIYSEELKKKQGLVAFGSAEIEGFLFDGVNAEQEYAKTNCFTPVSTGGYYHSLPLDRLRMFMDRAAEAQRAMGFRNEKDHPEVAPAQFEMNFSYSELVQTADNIQLYKLVCRQIASSMGMTASFLPKPLVGVNGSGMHMNFSLAKNGKNIFYDKKGQDGMSKIAWDFISKILNHAPETCLVFNPSVNSYRRLDPHFEAPNQIKVSSVDRGSMIRIPLGNEKTARIEMRSVAPDTNPYLAFFTMLKTGMEGQKLEKEEGKRDRLRFLPDNINDSIALYKGSKFIDKILGENNKDKYLAHKQAVADRSAKSLGRIIKDSEIIYHHEVTNQLLWNNF